MARDRERERIGKVFGGILREVRKAAGLSQEKLALDAGLERVFISMLERGQRTPSLTAVFQIAQALNIPASEIVTRVEQKVSTRRRP